MGALLPSESDAATISVAADRLQAALAGYPASGVCFQFDHLKRFQTKLRHRLIRRVEARGRLYFRPVCQPALTEAF